MDPRLKEISAALGRMIHGYQGLSLLSAAADLDLWSSLRSGPKTARELAEHAGSDESALARLLSGLVLIGALKAETIRTETAPAHKQYRMTALAQAVSDPRAPFADQIILAAREYTPAWLALSVGLKTSTTPFDAATGQSVWEHRKANPEVGAAFDRVMARVQAQTRGFILEHCDLSEADSLVDLGGGVGLLCAALCQKYARLHGIVFDQPHVEERATSAIAAANLTTRMRFVGGDFFESVPSTEALLLQHILHDWSDDECSRILQNCRSALAKGGRLFVVERLVGSTKDGLSGAFDPSDVLRDLHMLCLTGGRERTEDEFTDLLSGAGFEKVRSVVSGTGADLLEARAR